MSLRRKLGKYSRSSVSVGHLFEEPPQTPRYQNPGYSSPLDKMTLYVWPSVSLVSTSADWKADCTSLRGESVDNERWNKALLSLGVVGEPWCLRLGIKYCSTKYSCPGQVFEQVGWPWGRCWTGHTELGGYNYICIKMNAGLSPLPCLSYRG